MKSNWNYPTTVWTGEDRYLDIIEACSFAKINKPLFVTDKDLITLPMTSKVLDNLKKNLRISKFFQIFQVTHLEKI